jgi:GWxTD domain-containing protein
MADTSLRIAAQLDAQNPQYRLMVGKYLLASGVAITRAAADGFFQGALETARANNDTVQIAETAIESGRVHWRRYDALANRRIEVTPGSAIRSLTQAMNPTASDEMAPGSPLALRAVREALELTTQALPLDVTGRNDYDAAEMLFREAYRAAPDHPRVFRQLAMVLAEQNRWIELGALARGRIDRTPWDAWGWMTLGLASHRQHNSRAAAAAFDSAMSYVGAQDKARLDRIERILRQADTTVISRGDAAERMARLRLYWMFADPLWSREGNESRVEFLARVTFAELRWTVEELGVRGADTDRGDIYIRYGPPDLIAAFGPGVTAGTGQISTVWVYARGFMFNFVGAPTFATSEIPLDDKAFAQEMIDAQPVRWDNIAEFTVDSMPARVARFRADRDSVDLLVTVDPPVAEVAASAEVRATPRADFWMLRGGTVVVRHDSLRLTAPGIRSWTMRVAPGTYVYRAEVTVDAGTRAARAVAPLVANEDPLAGISLSGFGMSDLVLAASATPRRGTTGRRWRDLDIAPIIGTIPRNAELSLVWENYEFGRDSASGGTKYDVLITIERVRSTGGRIAARILGGIAGVVGADRTDDKLSIRFDRSGAFAPAFADHIGISLAGTPSGTYRLALDVTDLVTGRRLTRNTEFTIER